MVSGGAGESAHKPTGWSFRTEASGRQLLPVVGSPALHCCRSGLEKDQGLTEQGQPRGSRAAGLPVWNSGLLPLVSLCQGRNWEGQHRNALLGL